MTSTAHSGPELSHENAFIDWTWTRTKERQVEGQRQGHHGQRCASRPKNKLSITWPAPF